MLPQPPTLPKPAPPLRRTGATPGPGGGRRGGAGSASCTCTSVTPSSPHSESPDSEVAADAVPTDGPHCPDAWARAFAAAKALSCAFMRASSFASAASSASSAASSAASAASSAARAASVGGGISRPDPAGAGPLHTPSRARAGPSLARVVGARAAAPTEDQAVAGPPGPTASGWLRCVGERRAASVFLEAVSYDRSPPPPRRASYRKLNAKRTPKIAPPCILKCNDERLCAFVCAFVSAFACSFRGLFACPLLG